MARKKKETAETTGMVTVKMLSEEYGLDPRQLRTFLRRNGFSAPAIEQEGFGPRAKYEWPANSKELAKVRELIEAALGDGEEDDE